MTILCESDGQTANALLPSLGERVRIVGSMIDAAITLAENPEEQLLVIGADVPIPDVVSFTVQALANRPNLALVLLRRGSDMEDWRPAVDAGVHEVVVGGDAAELSAACERAVGRAGYSEQAETERANGKVVTVFSPKGGSGKTTIATNLSVVLAAAGNRVCLIDLDVEFGDVAISLQLTPTRSLADAVGMEPATYRDSIDALITPFSDGVDCVLAPIEPGVADKISTELVADVLAALQTRYDYVVVDTPSQISEHVLTALDASEHQVLLTNPEIPSLKNMRLTLDMLDLLGYSDRARHLLFNRADDSAGLTAADAESALHAPLTAHIPASRDVPASINRGVPIAAANPDHPVSVAIRNFALERIVGRPVQAKRSGLSRILRRRSS
jgi:pilus assembly protein CpaE